MIPRVGLGLHETPGPWGSQLLQSLGLRAVWNLRNLKNVTATIPRPWGVWNSWPLVIAATAIPRTWECIKLPTLNKAAAVIPRAKRCVKSPDPRDHGCANPQALGFFCWAWCTGGGTDAPPLHVSDPPSTYMSQLPLVRGATAWPPLMASACQQCQAATGVGTQMPRYKDPSWGEPGPGQGTQFPTSLAPLLLLAELERQKLCCLCSAAAWQWGQLHSARADKGGWRLASLPCKGRLAEGCKASWYTGGIVT